MSFSGYRPTVSVVAIILMLACRATTSIAHPHVWINYRLEILLVEGKLTAINQQWDFDQDYSSMLLHDQVKEHRKGTPLTEKEIAALHDHAFVSLADYGYFTHVWVGGSPVKIGPAKDFSANVDGDILKYQFTTPLSQPVDPRRESVSIGIWDDTYYVDIGPDTTNSHVVFLTSGQEICQAKFTKDHAHPIYFGSVSPIIVTITCL